jgi:hypothetical protein
VQFKSTLLPLTKSQFVNYFFGAIVLLVVACESPEKRPDNSSYFPIEVGSYRIYAVEEQVHSTGTKNVKSDSWFEKEEIIRVRSKPDGISECVISYSVRVKSTDYWKKTKEYLVDIYPDKVVQNKDNEMTTSLVFPYSRDVKWNGYEYLFLNDEDPRYSYLFQYEDLNKSLQIDSLHFPITLKVIERTDTSGAVLYRLGYKLYAAGVGLVMDVQTDYDYLQTNGELIDYRVIDKGVRRIRKIIGYGGD